MKSGCECNSLYQTGQSVQNLSRFLVYTRSSVNLAHNSGLFTALFSQFASRMFLSGLRQITVHILDTMRLPFAVGTGGGPIPLSAILEPVADLSQRKSGDFG